MNMFYTSLIILYTFIPPITLYYCQKLIYQKQHKYGWHLNYLAKYFITLSFLPILFLKDVDLALIPQSPLSLVFLSITIILASLGIKVAIKKQTVFFYIAGIFAAFMEELLFRGVLFGLAKAVWGSNITAIIVTSIAFGIWHLKNYAWHSDKKWMVKHFFITGGLYGPLFAVLRIVTGDLYLAILWHYCTDAYVALASGKWRRTIIGDRGKGFRDDYMNLKNASKKD